MLLANPGKFLDAIFEHLESDGIDVSKMELDHICYRVETEIRYLELKRALLKKSTLLSEALISGRPICSFKLNEPLVYQGRKIWILELPSPKKGSPYQEGYEHVEFVYPQILERFLEHYPDLKLDLKGFTKKVNRDVRLAYPNGSVKFHEHSLEYVIQYLDN